MPEFERQICGLTTCPMRQQVESLAPQVSAVEDKLRCLCAPVEVLATVTEADGSRLGPIIADQGRKSLLSLWDAWEQLRNSFVGV